MAAKTSIDGSARLAEQMGRLGARRLEIRRIVSLARKCASPGESTHESAQLAAVALVRCVADALGRLALDQPWTRSELRKIVGALAGIVGLPADVIRAELHTRVARDPRIIQLPPAVAIETEAKIFYALADVEHVSLWTRSAADPLRCVLSLGAPKPGRRVRLVARTVFDAGAKHRSGGFVGTPILRWQRPDAALVFRPGDGRELPEAAALETADALALVLERETLLARSAARERALVEAGERLLARLGFDLHDGPIQDVAALAGDIYLFRGQLEHALASTGGPPGLINRVDDLEARVFELDRTLRQLVHSLESPTVIRRPLDEALRREIEAFQAQTDIAVDLVLRGDFNGLTDSQRIAVLRIVQESLTNIREHSDGTNVTISVASRPSGIAAEITDNGRGFDVEQTLVRAARGGRLGLVGMSERARLLGGRFDVRSRHGGPTTVSVVLPAWRPAASVPGLAAEALAAV